MENRDKECLEDLDSIASILAAGYLKYRKKRREDLLDTSTEASPHGHEVNASEKGETRGNPGSQSD